MKSKAQQYWWQNLIYLAILLAIWFTQQGFIYVFVILIFVYVWLMNRLDKKFEYDEVCDGHSGMDIFDCWAHFCALYLYRILVTVKDAPYSEVPEWFTS